MIEIERKFLPSATFNIDDIKKKSKKSFQITQGYICDDTHRTVRVRTKSDKGFLTIKGIGNDGNLTRFEWENEIPILEATALLKICLPGIIFKTRFEILHKNHVFEIDVFDDDNKGLIIIELNLHQQLKLLKNQVGWAQK